jgi:hypothetical protein
MKMEKWSQEFAVYEKMVESEILENIDAVMKLRHNPEELNNMVLPER